MNTQWLTIKQLDQQLKEWRELSDQSQRPRLGWVKTLRTALNMSAMQIAKSLGVKRGRITQLENAEVTGGVTVRALKAAADAMGCEFVYAIVPKNFSTLEEMIKARAKKVAEERVASVAHSMALESQTVDAQYLQQQRDELTKSLIENFNKSLWDKNK